MHGGEQAGERRGLRGHPGALPARTNRTSHGAARGR